MALLTRVASLPTIALIVAGCHERLRPNEVVLIGNHSQIVAGSPVVSGALTLGHVERVQSSDRGTRVTIAFLRDSQPPLVAESISIKTTGLGQATMLEIRSGPPRPVFGPGGYLPGARPPR